MTGGRCIIIVGLLVALLGFSFPVKAQDNPFKIDNALYPLYERATKYRQDTLGLQIADTLYREAIRIDDKKAQCLALTIPVVYHYNHHNMEEFEKAVDRVQKVSRKNDYLQYYYFGCVYKVNFLMNQGKTLRALQEAEQVKQQAFTDNYPYGIASCLRIMGNIYQARRELWQALSYFQQAAEYYIEKNVTDQDISFIYYKIATIQEDLKQYDQALQTVEKAIKEAKTPTNMYAAMLRKCILLYKLDRQEEFNAYYQECMKATEKYGNTRRQEFQEIRICNYVLHQQYEKAHALADSAPDRDRLTYHININVREKNYKEAFRLQQELHHMIDSINQAIQSADLSELNVRIGNEQLKREAQEKEVERKLLIFKFVISFSCIFIIALIFYLYSHKNMIKKLQKKNEELTVAHDLAEQADKMKTYFIQNMSHEIRTPLNAIVGFSQLLSDPELPLGDEEKKEFRSLVLHNSELLTTLINDVLDLSSLESGKYTMNLAPYPCNEMCRVILSTVTHRKPEDVNLYFTTEVSDDFKIVTDEQRTRQVLINFLTNAEKHTEKGEIHLHCSTTENPGKITFSVTDTGSGIPVEQMDSVFERFKKLDEFKQGTGLGLNICRAIADRLHGEVKIDKTYTNGARFLFILPLEK